MPALAKPFASEDANSARLPVYFVNLHIAALAFACTVPFVDPMPVPDDDIPANALLLDTEPFPSDWTISPCMQPCELEGSAEALRDFGRAGVPGNVGQHIFHFANGRDARAKFHRYEETTTFPATKEITYRSPLADEQYLRCGIDVIAVCTTGLRYGEYFVEIDFHIDLDGRGEGLEMREVEPVLRAVDERVAELFDLPLPPD